MGKNTLSLCPLMRDFLRRDVTIGTQVDGYVKVISGLNKNERVVVKGGFLLKSEIMKEKFGEGLRTLITYDQQTLSIKFEYALKQGFLVIIVICVIIGMGLYYIIRLPIDAVPDVTTNQVQINTEVPGLGPLEVEKLITFPIEFSMSSLPDVVEVRSLSKTGLSQVTVVFDDHVNIYFARQLVLERLQTAKEQLPQVLMAQPIMGPISTGLGEIYQYVVTGEGKDNMELRTIQDWLIRPRLLTTQGLLRSTASVAL